MARLVSIVDTGIANIGSLINAFEHIEVDHVITNWETFEDTNCSHIVIPGVGSFETGMNALNKNGLGESVKYKINSGLPVLGVCLGMQLLFSSSEESPNAERGLGLIKAPVKKLPCNDSDCWPHIGWSSVIQTSRSAILEGIDTEEDFYFIHGFAAPVGLSTVGKSHFGSEFSAIVEQDNIFGVQFHPEKSQAAGLKLLKNFSKLP